MVEARQSDNQLAVRPPRVQRRPQRCQSAGRLIEISKLTFDKYIKKLIRQGVPLEQLR